MVYIRRVGMFLHWVGLLVVVIPWLLTVLLILCELSGVGRDSTLVICKSAFLIGLGALISWIGSRMQGYRALPHGS